jgi:hypothetical protein
MKSWTRDFSRVFERLRRPAEVQYRRFKLVIGEFTG